MSDLDDVRRLVAGDHGLVVVATTRADGSVQSSVVNAGVLERDGGEPAVGFVVRSDAVKVQNIRERPRASLTFRVGWEWVAVEGPATIVGPDEPTGAAEPEALRVLLRDVFAAAGGTHDDWDEYDRVMAAERRAAVLVTPERISGR